MLKKLVYIICIISGLAASAQQCPEISYPLDGSTDIAVNDTITWPAVDGHNGYLISLGTSPGATDILRRHPTGQVNFYTAPLGLPDNTDIYVSLNIFPFEGQPILCSSIMFRTVDVTLPPSCTILTGPDNNASNVTITTDFSWVYAPTATGYKISISTNPGGNEILNEHDVGNTLFYEHPADLPQFAQIYVRITPYNENGATENCNEERFFTGPAMDHCEPHIDEVTGELIDLRPKINFPNIAGICSNDLPFIIKSQDIAEGYRWFKINAEGPETLLSETQEVPLHEPGRYRYEIFNSIVISGITIFCTNSKIFDVVTSETATIVGMDIINFPQGRQVSIRVTGNGDYEYALDSADGPYQNSPVFTGVTPGPHIAYVRDKNGCGITQRSVDRDLTPKDFPSFFTPNGDGINDFWQFVPPEENFENRLTLISIFDRYGNLIARISPGTQGWDGKFQGTLLPSSDYWFKALVADGPEILGHFALKR